jgi:hypothetical protein
MMLNFNTPLFLKPLQVRQRNGTKERSEAMITNVNSYSSMVQRIDHVRVSKSDRRIAKECMRKAEFVADLICRAGMSLQAAAALMGRSLNPSRRVRRDGSRWSSSPARAPTESAYSGSGNQRLKGRQ